MAAKTSLNKKFWILPDFENASLNIESLGRKDTM